jgi:hypothetical protein
MRVCQFRHFGFGSNAFRVSVNAALENRALAGNKGIFSEAGLDVKKSGFELEVRGWRRIGHAVHSVTSAAEAAFSCAAEIAGLKSCATPKVLRRP